MIPMDIAVRAYVCRDDSALPETKPKKPSKKYAKRKVDIPSEWTVVFDTETTTDESQKLRFGAYQVRENEALFQSGIFYDAQTLSKTEQKLLKQYAVENDLIVLTVEEFIKDIFYGIGYACRASIVGLNLPFDISRLAIGDTPARANKRNKIMHGGFSFLLSPDKRNPRVQIKHASSRNSFIQFVATFGQRTNKGDRKKHRWQPVQRGYFLDIRTLAAALTGNSHSLASLPKALKIEAQKHDIAEHGKALTRDYIAYAVQDTEVTWECFLKLKSLYALHGLTLTAPHAIRSEASLGKAYLKEMRITPWMQLQPDFPPEMLGLIMSTYYGGRSEIHIRREITQVLYCDFLSMYPTVCTLMGLWRFVTAQGVTWRDSTIKTRKFLEQVTIAELQQQETWRLLCTIVQVMPDKDVFPVRAKYVDKAPYTIGSNYLTSAPPLWFTLADCISSKLLTGRTPKIVRAITFKPKPMQKGLMPVNVAGNEVYHVNPCKDDFFKRIIDLRASTKNEWKEAPEAEKHILNDRQKTLKTIANATTYGIFVELNVEEEKLLQPMLCYGASGKAIPIRKKKFEAAGTYFHPLLATLITGAARLMLSITERQAIDAGLDWAFCDTDSMALARPTSMPESEFIKKARQVQEWFTVLNPYEKKKTLLKIEDYNYNKTDKTTLQSLYCLAISSKRYGLFNIVDGEPILRKVSAHGLGHLIAPYDKADKPMLDDVAPWQQDFWMEIIQAEMRGDGDRPDFGKLLNFNMPVTSHYGATTPALAKWFEMHNKNKHYRDRVRPFNFLVAMQARPQLGDIKPVAPYDKNPAKTLSRCFDRATGENVSKNQLRNYKEALAQYHLHPEMKFLNGDFRDRGRTERRHIIVKAVQHIGKEANKWEEQFHLGYDPDAQIEYGISPDDKNHMLEAVLQSITTHGAKAVAKASRLSLRHVLEIFKGQSQPSDKALAKLYAAAQHFEAENTEAQELLAKVNVLITSKTLTCRALAVRLGVDASNLRKVLAGKRIATDRLIKLIADNL